MQRIVYICDICKKQIKGKIYTLDTNIFKLNMCERASNVVYYLTVRILAPIDYYKYLDGGLRRYIDRQKVHICKDCMKDIKMILNDWYKAGGKFV